MTELYQKPAEIRMSKPAIVTICGSMRFYPEMLATAAAETARGYIVLMPFCTVPPEEQKEEAKRKLDELHLAKIYMSDRIIFVTNGDGYMGESTRDEMVYAMHLKKGIEVRPFDDAEAVIIDGMLCFGYGHKTPQ